MKLFKLSRFREVLLAICDISIMALSYYLSLWIRFDFRFSRFFVYVDILNYNIILFVFLNGVFYFLFKVHKSLWRYFGIEEMLRVIGSVVFPNLLIFFYLILLPIQFPRSTFIINIFISATFMLGLRFSYRYYRRIVMVKDRKLHAVIIGAGDAGSILSREINTNPTYDCNIVGFVDDAKHKIGKTINGYTVLGSTNQLEIIVKKLKVDVAYVAIPSGTKTQIKEIVQKCKNVSLPVKIMGIQELNNKLKPILRDISIEDLLGRGEIHLNNSCISAYVKDQVVLVTGAGGSIGSELCRQLIPFSPKTLILLDIYENNLYDLEQEFLFAKRNNVNFTTEIKSIICSVRDKKGIDNILSLYKPNIVFHAAAHKHVPLMETVPQEAIKNNIFGTRNILLSCIENKVSRFILISTDKAVHPTNVMGATKRMTELLIQAYRNNGVTTVAAVRFGNVLGSNGSVIPLFKRQIEAGGPVTVTDPNITRYFMTIPEATQLVIQASAYATSGEVFVLDMGKAIKIVDLAENLIHLAGLKPYEDIQIEFTGLRPGEKMFEEIIFDNSKFRKTENELIYIAAPEDVDLNKFEKEILKLLKYTENGHVNLKKTLMEMIDLNYSDTRKKMII